MEYTGERMIPGRKGLELLELEHRTRYAAARVVCAGKRVLDLGSGAGYGAAMLAETADFVLGIDVSAEAVEFANGSFQRSNVEFIVGDISDEGLIARVKEKVGQPFDIVTCFEVIEHIQEPRKLLAAAKALLRPGGVLFVSTPNVDYPYESGHDNPHHVMEYSQPEFTGLLRSTFGHLAVFGQQIHLMSSIGYTGQTPDIAEWRNASVSAPKYYLAVCSDEEAALAPINLFLITGDQNVRILQERLREVKQDQAVKGQRIQLLERHITDKELASGARSTGLKLENEELSRHLSKLKTEVADAEARKREAEAQRQKLQDDLRGSQAEIAKLRVSVAHLEKTLTIEVEEARREIPEDAPEIERFRNEILAGRDKTNKLETDLKRTRDQLSEARRESAKLDQMLRNMYTQFERANAHWWWRLGLKLRRPLAALGLMSRRPVFGFDTATKIMLDRASGGPAKATDGAPTVSPFPGDKLRAVLTRAVADAERDLPLLAPEDEKAMRLQLLERPQDFLVSVIVPAYNRAAQIVAALDSVLAQTYKNWECLVVDDGSTDNTASVVQQFAVQDSRIKYMRINHEGVSAARDAGIKAARGEYIAYLDSDNTWKPDYLLFTVNAMVSTGKKCSYSAMDVVDRDSGGDTFVRARKFSYQDLLKNNYIDINIFAHHRSLVDKLGGFDKQLRRWVDWDVILRYTKHYEPAQIPVSLCKYYSHKKLNQITHDEPHAFKFKVLGKHLVSWTALEEKAAQRVAGMASIVIPVYNDVDLTRKCVESILAHTQGREFEVVIVDNGSDPAVKTELEVLATVDSRVRVVRNYENYMFALGNNIGVAATRGEFIVLLNNDTLVTDDWLTELIRPLETDANVGLTGPKLLYPDGTTQAAGIVFSSKSKIPYHIYQYAPGDAPYVNKERTFAALTGACMAMRAADYIALRGFDARYVNGSEDIDLCLRLKSILHKTCLYRPSSVVYHLESKTPGRSKAIGHNRSTFVSLRGKEVVPDDQRYYAEDGFKALRYEKAGSEPDGETALYRPVLDGVQSKTVTVALKEASAPPGKTEPAVDPRPARVLVIKPSGIGNMVMFTPALKALREYLPNSRIAVACYRAEAAVIEDAVDGLILLERKDPATGAVDKTEFEEKVFPGEYDIALYPPFTNLGRPTPYLERVIPKHITHPRIDYHARHEVLHNLDVVEQLGWRGAPPRMQMDHDAEAPARFGLPERLIGVHCGASGSIHMQKKKWPADHWAALLDRIPGEYTVVFCGGPDEVADTDAVKRLLKRRPASGVASIVGRATLAETAGVIAACDLFISNDSGLMHVACAVNTPVIALFGPTLPSKNGPWGPEGMHRMLSIPVPCGPCYDGHPKRLLECQDQICLSNLTPDSVYQVVEEKLGAARMM